MKKILLPEKIIPEGMVLFEGKAEIVLTEGYSEVEIISKVKEVHGIVLRSSAKITRKILESAPQLKIISRTGAGYDNVDVTAATEHGVMVCNLPGVNNLSVAEHTVAFIFALMKQLPTMDSYVRNGGWKKRSQYISMEIEGKTIGIVGLGKIGYKVAVKCKALGMNIIAYDPYVEHLYKDEFSFCESLKELFEKADIVSVHVPNLPETRGMITEELLWSMKRNAFFINTSRGEVVDEGGLVAGLKEGRIAGAALDVFMNEPVDESNPLLKMNNVILSPHTAALTKECGVKMTVDAVKQVIDYLEGRTPPYIVNRKELNFK